MTTLLLSFALSLFAHAEISSTPFPDNHGNSTAIAANTEWVVVGTDAGYLEILNRKTNSHQSLAIYKGPYRTMPAVALDGDYAYAVVDDVALFQVELKTAQVVDQLKAKAPLNYLKSLQIFDGVAYVQAYPGFFKLNLKEGKISDLKPQPIQLPVAGTVYQVHMQTPTTGVAIVATKLPDLVLHKFDLQKNTSQAIPLPDLEFPQMIATIADVLYLQGKDQGSTDSRNDAYLAVDLSSGQYTLPFSKNWTQLPVLDIAVSGDLSFIAAWGKGLVVMPTPQKLAPVTQVFPADLFTALGEPLPLSFHWSCESVSQYGIPSEWKVDFGIMISDAAPSDKLVPYTVLIAHNDWQTKSMQYFTRHETGFLHNEEGEFSVRFSKPGGSEWDAEGVLSAWKNHNDDSPMEFKIWLQREPEISSSAIKLNCMKVSPPSGLK